MSNQHFTLAYYADPLPVIMEDDPIHCDPYPFCSDPTCPCHEPANNEEAFSLLSSEIASGQLTPSEATRIVNGMQGGLR